MVNVGLGVRPPPGFITEYRIRRVKPGFSMERKERKLEFKHYEVLDKMSCVDGLEDLRTDKPQSIGTQPNLNIKRTKHRSAEGENMLQT